jgi:type II secretory ATPase GspE/PulE/Tfp pilus assembly ATPase PilB-like protein
MFRTRIVLLLALLLLVSVGQTALAQTPSSTWPANLDRLQGMDDKAPVEKSFASLRGKGEYFSTFKLLLCWFVFAGWVYTTDWINQDGQRRKANFRLWNLIATFSFVGVLLLVWLIDYSIVLTFPLLVAGWVAPLAVYIKQRNAKVHPSEQVLTKDHLRFWVATHANRVGIKMAVEAKKDEGPPIELLARGGETPADDAGNLLRAKHMPGFRSAGELVVDALTSRARAVMLDFSREAMAMRYQIDGVWSELPPRDRASGDAMLEVLKTLAGLKPSERLARQRGVFEAKQEKTKYPCRITSQGTKTGERAVLIIDDGKPKKARLDSIGMRDKMQEQVKAIVGEKAGFVLVSAPAGGGLTTLLSATAGGVDRFMRSVVGVEPVDSRELEVENVPMKTYNPAAEETPMTVLPELVRQYPDAFVVSELTDADTVQLLCEQVTEEHRLVVAGIRAAEASEALLRVLMLKANRQQFVPAITASINTRLIRKLCESCKESYRPTPQLLQQLKMPADKIDVLYGPPQPKPLEPGQKPPPVCTNCKGVGYQGQTALFELLVVDDGVRAALLKQPKMEVVRQMAAKAGMRSLQEEGLALVAKGVTSLQELMRVLKEKE